MSSLPTELWSAAFDYLDLDDLIAAAHVSAIWRLISFDHPTFWRDVSISSTSSSSLALAEHRLGEAKQRPWHLNLRLLKDEDTLSEPRLVLLLHRYLPYARRIIMRIRASDADDAWTLLSAPAPALEHCDITAALSPGQSPPSLPRDLFAEVAPRLYKLLLQDITLPTASVAAFSFVESATLRSPRSAWEVFPYHLLTIFPCLRSLTMAGGCVDFRGPVPHVIERGLSALRYFDIEYYSGESLKFFRSLPCQRIPLLLVAYPDDDSVLAALQHLQCQRYRVLIVPTVGGEFHIEFRPDSHDGGTTQGLCRIFAEIVDDYESDDPLHNIMFKQPDIAAKITALSLATSLWPMISRVMQPLPEVTSLRIIIDNGRDGCAEIPQDHLRCPQLQLLCLASSCGFVRVSPDDVVALVPRLTSRYVKLELDGVALNGALSSDSLYFSELE
ncbi:hypothetical protein EXIGLDRAFT_729288 [Exidia glandulosa HHB12029]|uniref:F-box domain-containing protein n=1 Tax=Exidia glandulosa HHB12029 TaxID=1314781 RepID=A0A165CN62_EXIGL|nr:hypothetical protein EXIGLDRAFT_729288 [Exidia glandulosa HHB12029]